ncbi:Kae1-associated kinase Bud32 [Candidatus Pacearchaeota archaeon CG1_02_30_18]|nr:Kae1-associated serine/threonine protein kinase [Candidatus Pacearchaeota archaeon]OIO40545.1 MAG: Kae1-associated kinase Bud32 [Candidatus Pacearchaeota archaeon CG1_02_30_18]PIN71539.1 MAG: Kae1-associated kinase Bud32 [Candidatus Pacearchaeota archaeon CG11_big_fil_rev_8_21_14_0_20_30_13]PIZ81737.1 MAG: Kae1-associated kinase Bud32 [Candidatus Pacearchaeota archaeon CG_4_10_14_0_2_um_filter_30_11]PJA71618.1 MAG: Kae1-associated kinase Bud32 [Candidatus Pacearchaeota archaeon CG_4_9_14_3_u
MAKKIFNRGAEALIYFDGKQVIKERTPKSYRLPELDKKIIKRRTKSETKILKKASSISNVPCPNESKKEGIILIPLIEGDKLSEKLNSYEKKKQIEVMKKIGKETSKIHKEGIIHGDLTTSNMILKGNEVYIIDFGLGSLNGKDEQKGVDIHLLKEALDSKHFENSKNLFLAFKKGYESLNKNESKKVFEKLKKIEKRGRYKY